MRIDVFGNPAPRKPNGTFVRLHGLAITKNPVYVAWKGIRRRCCDEKSGDFKHYGGRGIKLFAPWVDSPELFVQYVTTTIGEKRSGMSIDRINNDGNYEPDNIRWATKKQQTRNRRTSHFVTHDGSTKTVQEWSEITGIKQATIRWRSAMGFPSSEILNPSDRRAH